ncbi:hypothetical protein VN1215_05990 [Helicobacter pylori]|nr:hypothetical protein VN1215_05990 [Helicobacter pylori]
MHLFSGALQRVGHTNFTNNLGDTLLLSYEFIIISFTSLSFNFSKIYFASLLRYFVFLFFGIGFLLSL